MSTKQQDPSCIDIRARIARVEERYVVTYPLEDCGDLATTESVTFALSVWRGAHPPQIDQIVILCDTALWVRGWRANSAQPVTPISKAKKGECA